MKITVAVVHLIFATIWLGSAFFYVVLVLPKLRAVDASQAVALKRSLRATMTPLLMVSALATIVSGLAMMVELHTTHPGPLAHSRWGVSLVVGALASVAAVVIAVVVESLLRRDERRRGEVASPARTPPRILQEGPLRLIALALLVLALGTMAVARYS